jgi:NADH:ubiquinone oxidoreductase subunit 3 (subunit A)
MLSQWGFVLMLSAIAVIIPVAAITLGHFLGPRRPDPVKNQTYESGVETIGDTWVQFRAQYYLIGLIFLIFDVEVIFLFPIAVAYQGSLLLLGDGGRHLCGDPDSGSPPRVAQGRARVGLMTCAG